MKTIISVMAIAIMSFFPNSTHAQSLADSLRKYCIIDLYARFILENASFQYTRNMRMSEYTKDIYGREFYAEMAICYQWGNSDIPLNCVANDMWSLVSKQLHSEVGELTLTKTNFIPTKNPNGEAVLAVMMWDTMRGKWIIMSVPLFKVKTLYKGGRMFAH